MSVLYKALSEPWFLISLPFKLMLMTSYLWYLSWGLLPLIPAILLYKFFPTSQAEIATPGNTGAEKKPGDAAKPETAWFQKLTGGFALRLSGAVAVYFIVFYLMDPVKNGYFVHSNEKSWELKTSFVDERGNPIPFRKIKNVEMIPNINVREDVNGALVTLGKFQEKDNKLTIPFSLRFYFDGYEPEAIPLADSLNSKTFCDKQSEDCRIILKPRKIKSGFIQTTAPETEYLPETIIN